jgi:hypothetical protein
MANNQFYEVMYEKKVIDMREIFKQKEDEKFKGKIFCPECGQAKVFIRGKKKEKIIVDTEMSIHSKTCSYNYTKINFKQEKLVYNEMETYQIDKALKEKFINTFTNKKHCSNIIVQIDDKVKDKVKRSTVAMPFKNVENIDEKDLKSPKLFYGTCKVEVSKNPRGYTIKLHALKSGFQFFAINVSTVAYDHFPKSVKNSLSNPIRPINFVYYGVLNEDKKRWKTTTLKNTNCLIVGPGEIIKPATKPTFNKYR